MLAYSAFQDDKLLATAGVMFASGGMYMVLDKKVDLHEYKRQVVLVARMLFERIKQYDSPLFAVSEGEKSDQMLLHFGFNKLDKRLYIHGGFS